MRTTLAIDDDLYRQIKAKAALEGRRVTDLVEEGMRAVLGRSTPADVGRGGHPLRLPLVPARPGEGKLFAGMTTQEIHERLSALQLEADRKRVGPSP